MSYIWQEYSRNNRFTVSFERISPYMEVWDMNDKNNISVNPFYRIYEIIFPDDDPEKIIELAYKYDNIPQYKDIVNLLIHEIAQTDRLKGTDLLFVMELIEERFIQEGKYGHECRSLFNSVSAEKQELILRYLSKYDISDQRENVFDSVLSAMFDDARMYYERSTEHVHIYINEVASDENINALSLASILFKNINIQTEVTWDNHFGIIGFDNVMKQDSIQII